MVIQNTVQSAISELCFSVLVIRVIINNSGGFFLYTTSNAVEETVGNEIVLYLADFRGFSCINSVNPLSLSGANTSSCDARLQC